MQWRIQDFPEEGASTPQGGGHQRTILPNFPKNCVKLKEFGPPGGCMSLAPSPLRSTTVMKYKMSQFTVMNIILNDIVNDKNGHNIVNDNNQQHYKHLY